MVILLDKFEKKFNSLKKNFLLLIILNYLWSSDLYIFKLWTTELSIKNTPFFDTFCLITFDPEGFKSSNGYILDQEIKLYKPI